MRLPKNYPFFTVSYYSSLQRLNCIFPSVDWQKSFMITVRSPVLLFQKEPLQERLLYIYNWIKIMIHCCFPLVVVYELLFRSLEDNN